MLGVDDFIFDERENREAFTPLATSKEFLERLLAEAVLILINEHINQQQY